MLPSPQNYARLAALEAHEKARYARQGAISRAWDAYNGKTPDAISTRRGEDNANLRMNLLRRAVDRGASSLMADGELELTVTDLARRAADASAQTESPAQQQVDALMRRSHGPRLLQRMALMGAITGSVYVKLQVGKDGKVRLRLLQTEDVETIPSEDDPYTPATYIITWTVARGRDMLVRRQTISQLEDGTWTIVDEEDAGRGGWVVVGETPWAYPLPPIVHCQNLTSVDAGDGIPDVSEDAVELQMAINKVLSSIHEILREMAGPIRYATGVGDELFEIYEEARKRGERPIKPGDILVFQGEDAQIHQVEMTKDLSSSLELLDRLVSALHSHLRVPELDPAKMSGIGSLSGRAMRLLYQDLIERTMSKRSTYGGLIREACQRALMVMGLDPEQYDVTVHWPEFMPADEESQLAGAKDKLEVGVSRDTVLQELGYDPIVQAERRAVDQLAAQQLADATGGSGAA